MESSDTPILKDLVLVGGGHSHVTVLKKFGMKPLPGVRLTLICRDLQAPYSGMLPGFIAGHYTFDEAHIDLGPLARFANARFYLNEVTRIDPDEKLVICKGRPPVKYDLLSINIGSAPNTSIVKGAAGNVVPVKPIDGFVAHWDQMRERILTAKGKAKIGIVGGGAGGVEITLAIQFRLKQLLAETGADTSEPEFHLFTDNDILLTHNRKVREKYRRVLAERNVTIHLHHEVNQVGPGRLDCANGETFELDEILWVTMASAQNWLKESGLEVAESGFVKVNDTLESVSHPGIFAAGDVADMINHPRPKSGVFAVRQGPPLERNLRRALTGRTLKPFEPQQQFLSLISTGDKYAVASRSNWAAEGKLIWHWKDWIDRRFMRKFSDLPDMDDDEEPEIAKGLANQDVIKEISAIAMRCGGCGAKVGATVLERALQQLEPVDRGDVLIGLHEPDDAAVVQVPDGKVMVHTVDAFRAFIDDPYVFGQIAANHAMGDIFAMGGEPQTALSIVTLPFGLESKVEDDLSQLMAGAMKVLNETGTALVGGHTSEGSEMSLGFAINGLVDKERILRKGGMKPGDKIILTKPIGTGTLFAADMRHKAHGPWIDAALAGMLQSNKQGADILYAHGANACTDVTGFGLLGHLVEMTKPSGVDVHLDIEAIPLLDGALELVQDGIFSSLQPQNVRLRRAIRNVESASKNPRYPLIFDPQTSGGLLATVPSAQVEVCVEKLVAAGYTRTAVIGTVKEDSGELEPITLAA
ncbi:MAG: selenide, water dikinase SelD [Rhodospirillaceae bacterium]|nr:selenide, water dikinase SelD [Rhodospirillaceae bacterium]